MFWRCLEAVIGRRMDYFSDWDTRFRTRLVVAQGAT